MKEIGNGQLRMQSGEEVDSSRNGYMKMLLSRVGQTRAPWEGAGARKGDDKKDEAKQKKMMLPSITRNRDYGTEKWF